jgi:hypothetical protein
VTRRPVSVNLTVGQEACLILIRDPSRDFYLVANYYDVINRKGNPSFAAEMNEIRHVARLLANPKASLEAKDRDEKYLTAALLITRYRTARPYSPPPGKTEPIPADESKRLLEILADADWSDKATTRPPALSPRNLFFRLNLTAADGWVQPKNFLDVPREAQKWLKEHAGTYRIQRYVSPVRVDDSPDK